ncbi:Crp/Fnr family transcriptional regulator [Pseudoflavonifractor sp. 524-17]|uniref:Crp/Fnr family transcriptional regulator n=1 Tax=Pseudoflavonifractor sp. 524-17 TaxID=2304577 RepID=UPI00325AA1E7
MEQTLPDSQAKEIIEQSVLFREVSETAVRWCLDDRRCVCLAVPGGGEIYTPQAYQRSLGIILSGAVQVSKGPLLLSRLKAGDLFGAAALFQEGEDYATTLTATVDCQVMLLQQTLVEELLERSPQAARNYVGYLTERIRFLSGRMDGLLAGSAEQKLARYLLEREETGRVELTEAGALLARRIHVSRASLYRAFDALQEAGAAEKRGKIVSILDRNKLQDCLSRVL